MHGGYADFYSRPCGRGDIMFMVTPHAQCGISTHAPAGGATMVCECQAAQIIISTHAPAGGATVVLFDCVRRIDDFYSRPCGRGDGHIAG